MQSMLKGRTSKHPVECRGFTPRPISEALLRSKHGDRSIQGLNRPSAILGDSDSRMAHLCWQHTPRDAPSTVDHDARQSFATAEYAKRPEWQKGVTVVWAQGTRQRQSQMTLRAGHAGLTFRHRPVWSDLRWRSESQTSAARRAKRGQHKPAYLPRRSRRERR